MCYELPNWHFLGTDGCKVFRHLLSCALSTALPLLGCGIRDVQSVAGQGRRRRWSQCRCKVFRHPANFGAPRSGFKRKARRFQSGNRDRMNRMDRMDRRKTRTPRHTSCKSWSSCPKRWLYARQALVLPVRNMAVSEEPCVVQPVTRPSSCLFAVVVSYTEI